MKIAILLLVSSLSFAGFKMGKYKGITKNAQPCQIEFIVKNYVSGIKNPINEEILTKVPGHNTLFVLKHMPSIDKETNEIKFERDFLKDFHGDKTGGIALNVEMIHSDTYHGPKSFKYIVHNWREKKLSVFECHDLVKH